MPITVFNGRRFCGMPGELLEWAGAADFCSCVHGNPRALAEVSQVK
jgi:uncharacterized protein (DUF3820 family)